MVGFKAARPLYKPKKVVRDKGLEALRPILAHLCGRWSGLRLRDLSTSLKKWSGIRDLKLLGPILAHLCGRWSGLRLRDLSTS